MDDWDIYRETRDLEVRNRLALRYQPLVHYVAARLRRTMPPNVEYGDLVSYGMLGLFDAIDRFDPDKGVKFETYAGTRVRGEILDRLRAMDWVPRSERAKVRSVDKTIEALEAKLAREPTTDEVAEALELTADQVSQIRRVPTKGAVMSIHEVLTPSPTRVGPGAQPSRILEDELGTEDEESIDDPLGTALQVLGNGISQLGIRERIVLTLYYFQGLTLSDIGRLLGVTESRVCQIHTHSILSLRHRVYERAVV